MSDAVFISDAQGNFIEFNEAFATFHRFPDKNACLTVLADYPGILEVTFDGSVAPMDAWAIPRALRGEAASNLEFGIRRTDTGEAWVGSYSFAPIRDPGGAIVGAVVAARDVTDHKRRELNAVFLARIGKDFARLKSPESIIRSLGKRISNYLDVAAVSYCSVNHRGDHVEAHLTWHKDDPSGRRPVPDSDCLTGEFARASRAGESFVVSDAAHDPRVNNAACARQGIGSFVTVPFHSRGQWKAFLAISGDAPRAWLPHELELVAEIAQRVFPRLQRAEAEDALRRSEEKYRTLYSKIDEGFCIIEMIFDADGVPSDYRFIEVNPAFEKQAGLVNVHGRRMRELAPDHDQHWFEVYGKVALTGESIRYQNHSRTLHRYFDVYAFRIGPPHAHQVAVLFSDISQRIRAEEELRASEHRLGLALDAAHAAAWEVDLASGVLFGDFRFNRLLQIAQSTSTEVPQRWLELVLPEDRERAAAEFAAACEEGAAPYDSEFRALRMDGVQRWYHSRGIVEREPSGSRMLGVIQDITEHKHAEDALREADRRKDEFLAILSHELRNPLAPIRTGVHLLKLAYDEPTTRNLVPMLERQVDHLTRLLDDLLNVSRIIRGQIDLRIQLIDLAAAIRIAVEATSPMIRAMGHELVLNLPNSPVMLHADPDRLAQMFSNFLHNAAKYMPTAGRIDLGVTRQDDHVFVSVRDQGIGLTAASITSVFDLFFQVGVAEGKIQDGLGIGLSLVKRLAELHGGHVVAHSEGPGRGSEFLVQLPVITTTHH
jgi:PAS domain S-box-containing protein